ncbi:MAG: hypothetical protein ABIK65_09385 [Candidatus Eisenbacteria bacterium]
MHESFRAFMAGLIDYAGLFPPTALDPDRAIRNYARYRAGRDAWILGRFITSARGLADLAPYHDELFAAEGEPYRFSVLAGFGDDEEEALAALEVDARAMAAFRERHGARVRIDAIETKLPEEAEALGSPGGVAEYLRRFAAPLERGGNPVPDVWVEVPAPRRWLVSARAAIEGIGKIAGEGGPRFGFKLRCGGGDLSAFPGTGTAAFAIAACRDGAVPMKWTAGLHHPVRRRDAGLEVMSHGFLNMFGAAILARAHSWTPEKIEACLADEEPGHFTFDGDSFSWKKDSVPAAEIARARGEFATGYGSCSFDEPREDLAALGWMEPVDDTT